MDVKEAIEFLENRYDYKPHRNSAYIISKYNEAIGVVCKNFEQGEAYKAMWDRLEHGVVYDDEGNYTYSWSDKLIGHMHRIKREEEQKS